MAQSKYQRKAKSAGSSLEMAQFLNAGANKIKKRIRDLERLLSKKKDILPHTVIIEKERILQALRLELESAVLKQKAKKNASKYHMVRFFERKKAMRKYSQSLKKLEKEPNEENKKDLLERKIDLCYVVNFPKIEKYIALYPTNTDVESKEAKKTALKRQTFRELVATQLKEGTLPVSFEDILKGKKLNKEGTGIDLSHDSSETTNDYSGNNNEEEAEEEDDDFFE
ncbi:hypothetical protein KAFR_0D01880 [Kazachstania africana CBS 2517]|uniref:rRNA-processing protein EFG1 n=1 Tax=Kazachstania africana (strain ATCC 22294 / BCRC 22015 / CBS 2517 / CECT 1963 / NBRC 1671 / NRRL Y-8276) TaxID=1071382 RepID=H2ATY5_KAZAF|nr:hypothetical protein KAFR_0D01880 [Kazachstania africana CBS 2517]CCF57835.1 hypothetical protein KAFR_0D01880 [Kazachstania africana CBS 2517]